MKSVTDHIVTSSPPHFVHLSYTLARPAYTDPEVWLKRVSFVSGVPEKMVPFGNQTVIYNIHFKGEIHRNGVSYLFPAFKRWQLVFPFTYTRLIRNLKPDVVLVHGLIFPWQIIMLRKAVGPHVKIICQHHAERPFRDFRATIFRWADKYIGAYLFASKVQGEEWVKAKQISSINKVHEIMGTSSIFKPDLSKKERNIYLWIGDLDENKDPMLAARAFSKFSKNKNVTLLMIYQNNQLESQLRSIINPSIQLIGKVAHQELQRYFDQASYIISTSHYEGSGIAVCEAMSCGCTPVLTNIPSFRMMTDHGRIGKLFEPGDEDGLIKALEETYGHSQSGEVLEYFNRELSFEANAQKIINVVKDI